MRSLHRISGLPSHRHMAWFTVPACIFLVCLSAPLQAETIVTWDFTQGDHGWTGNNFVRDLAAGPEGLAFVSTGIDPWIEGPPVDLSQDGMTRIAVRMKSDADAGAELCLRTAFRGRTLRSLHGHQRRAVA